MTKLRRKLNRAVVRFCAKVLASKSHHQSGDKGNMNALRQQMGMAPFHRGQA